MRPRAVDVLDILVGAMVAERPEDAQLDRLGEADDGVERRAQLVAHIRQELGFTAAAHDGGEARGLALGVAQLAQRQQLAERRRGVLEMAQLGRDEERQGAAPVEHALAEIGQPLGDAVDRRDGEAADHEVEQEAQHQADRGDHPGDGEGVAVDLLRHRAARPRRREAAERLALDAHVAREGEQRRLRRQRLAPPFVEHCAARIDDVHRGEAGIAADRPGQRRLQPRRVLADDLVERGGNQEIEFLLALDGEQGREIALLEAAHHQPGGDRHDDGDQRHAEQQLDGERRGAKTAKRRNAARGKASHASCLKRPGSRRSANSP